MTCKTAQKLIPLFVGGDLPERLAVRLSGHLDQCEVCASERRALEASQRFVRRAAFVDRPPPLPMDFAARVRAEVAGTSRAQAAPPAGGWTPFSGRPLMPWAVAAALLIAGLGLLNGYLRLQPKTLPGSVAQQGVPAKEVVASDESKEESPEVTASRLAGLMSRLNPRRDLTDEELDARYPVVESISQPQGTAMVYHTRDPRVTVVWVLEPVAPGKGEGVR